MGFVFSAILGLLSVEPAGARTIVIQKRIDPEQLVVRLKEAGFGESVLQCPPGRTRCVLHLSDNEKRSPLAVIDAYVFVDAEAMRAKKRSEISALVMKLKSGSITQEERDRILAWVTDQLLSQ